MRTVSCKVCRKNQEEADCWCVIDIKTKERYYECKKVCNPPRQIQTLVENIHSVPLEIETPETSEIHDWAEAYPQRGFLQRVMNWFLEPSGYTKVKTQ